MYFTILINDIAANAATSVSSSTLCAILERQRTKNGSQQLTAIKTIGKIIIVLAFLASLNPYFLIFTVPAFLIGAIIIWASNLQTKAKALWTILPIALWFPAFFAFMCLSGVIGTATAQKLDFIFSANFEGKAVVIENMPCGQPVRTVKGREQLFIPDNGVLLYNGELKGGYVNHRYYRLLPGGQKIAISDRASYMYFDSEKQKPDTKAIGVWLTGTGSGTNAKGKYYSFMDLLVASKDSIDKYYEFKYSNRFEALTDSLITQCK